MRHISRAEWNRVFQQVVGAELPGIASPPNVWAESVTQQYRLSSRFVLEHGGMPRVFYYAHIHPDITAAIGRGRVMMASDDGAERGAFLGAQTAGAYTVTWTTVAAVTADQFRHGFVLLQGGFVREIAHNTAGGAGAVITLTLFDPIPETVAAGRYAIIQEHPYANVYNRGTPGVHPNAEGAVMGVTTFDPTVDYYLWLQTWGPCGVIATPATLGDADNEMELHHGVQPGDEVTIATGHGYQSIGYSLIANAINWDNENFMIVDLRIRP